MKNCDNSFDKSAECIVHYFRKKGVTKMKFERNLMMMRMFVSQAVEPLGLFVIR